MKEDINHPERYGGDTTYECVKVLKAWMSADEYKGFLRGNALKYLCRVGKKDEAVKELKKAKWYIEKLIETENEEPIDCTEELKKASKILEESFERDLKTRSLTLKK